MSLRRYVRGSPSLVGRGIANPMSARTRGFKSPSPRHNHTLQHPNLCGVLMDEMMPPYHLKTRILRSIPGLRLEEWLFRDLVCGNGVNLRMYLKIRHKVKWKL